MACSRRVLRRCARWRAVSSAIDASTNSAARAGSEARLSSSAVHSLASVSWLPRHSAALSWPACSHARAPWRDPPAGAQALHAVLDPGPQPGPGDQQCVVRDPGRADVHGDHPLVDERGEHLVGVAPLPQLGQVDGGAARRQVVGHVHQPQEQPPRQPPLLRRQAAVRPLRGPGERVPDPAAGEIVGDGQRAAAALLPGGEHRVRQQRQRALLVRPARVLRRQDPRATARPGRLRR